MVNTSTLPRPVADNWDWQRRAACRDCDNDLFFHPDAERGHVRELRIKAAKAVCRSCPVIVQCRHYALTSEELFGVWGGLDERERKAAIGRRRRRLAAA